MAMNARGRLLLVAMILSIPLLANCEKPIHPKATKPPPELLACAAEPLAPNLPQKDGTDETQINRDNLTLEFILALRGAYGDCRSKVDGVRAWAEALPD